MLPPIDAAAIPAPTFGTKSRVLMNARIVATTSPCPRKRKYALVSSGWNAATIRNPSEASRTAIQVIRHPPAAMARSVRPIPRTLQIVTRPSAPSPPATSAIRKGLKNAPRREGSILKLSGNPSRPGAPSGSGI
jgi:hypothetical protein